MKLHVIFTFFLASASTSFTMDDPKKQAKDEFLANHEILNQLYQRHTIAQMAPRTSAYLKLKEDSLKFVESYRNLEKLKQDTPRSRALFTKHYQRLLEIISAHEQPLVIIKYEGGD